MFIVKGFSGHTIIELAKRINFYLCDCRGHSDLHDIQYSVLSKESEYERYTAIVTVKRKPA
jgi:hypothetical protein